VITGILQEMEKKTPNQEVGRLYSGVIRPMFDQNITHGVIAGIIKCPLYVQENT
jgi:hypothetical protein